MNPDGALPYTIVVVLAVALHFVFIGYLVVGGFLAWRRPATIGLHLAVVGWGAASLTLGLPCPLTDLERFGRAGAAMGELSAEGFIEHYLTGVWYPADSTAAVQALVFCTVLCSWLGLGVRRPRRSPAPGPRPTQRLGQLRRRRTEELAPANQQPACRALIPHRRS